MAFRRPRYDMPLSNQGLKKTNGGFRSRRLIEELDHQRKIDVQSQDVVRVHLPARAESCNASEDSDALHGVLVVQRSRRSPA